MQGVRLFIYQTGPHTGGDEQMRLRIRDPRELVSDREAAGMGRMLAVLAIVSISVLFVYYLYGKGKEVADVATAKTTQTIQNINP